MGVAGHWLIVYFNSILYICPMKPIKKYPGYFADELGNIYTMRPIGRSLSWRTTPYKVSLTLQPNGYLGVNLMLNKKMHRELVHLIIITLFKGERPSKKHQACHGIGGKQDNSIGNLDWKTISQNNMEDKIRDNTFRFGDHHGMSKLTCEKVKKIKHLLGEGKDNHTIASMFNVHHSNISKIKKGHTWRHVV